MIDWIYEIIKADWFALYFYFIPIFFALAGAALKTFREVVSDRVKRERAESSENGWYIPSVTVGTILGRCILSVFPVANFFYAVYLLFSEILENLVSFLGEFFNTPLVPEKKKTE